MQVLEEPFSPLYVTEPCAFTLGNFDGLHLGHRHLLDALQKIATNKGTTAVGTFKNHPASILRPTATPATLSDLPTKLELFEKMGIDLVLLFTFTQEFSLQPFDIFIEKLRLSLPFSHLILGEGAVFGKNQEGTEEKVESLGKKLNFSVTYLPKQKWKETVISSGKIRTLISQGSLHEAEELLGRPYTLTLRHISEKQVFSKTKGLALHFPLKEFCLPPMGFYLIRCQQKQKKFLAIGHVEKKNEPLLEIYLLEGERVDYTQELFISFLGFIRNEYPSNSFEELREQINRDLINNQLTIKEKSE